MRARAHTHTHTQHHAVWRTLSEMLEGLPAGGRIAQLFYSHVRTWKINVMDRQLQPHASTAPGRTPTADPSKRVISMTGCNGPVILSTPCSSRSRSHSTPIQTASPHLLGCGSQVLLFSANWNQCLTWGGKSRGTTFQNLVCYDSARILDLQVHLQLHN